MGRTSEVVGGNKSVSWGGCNVVTGGGGERASGGNGWFVVVAVAVAGDESMVAVVIPTEAEG